MISNSKPPKFLLLQDSVKDSKRNFHFSSHLLECFKNPKNVIVTSGNGGSVFGPKKHSGRVLSDPPPPLLGFQYLRDCSADARVPKKGYGHARTKWLR